MIPHPMGSGHAGAGRSSWRLGVHDLVTCEVCWWLLDPGGTAVDVGANIGVVTGLLARRAGPAGEVWGFEPHPDVRTELVRHVGLWQRTGLPLTKIQTHGTALSNVAGEAALFEPRSFGGNHGTASLEAVSSGSDATHIAGGRCFKVPTQTRFSLRTAGAGSSRSMSKGTGRRSSPARPARWRSAGCGTSCLRSITRCRARRPSC